MFQTIRPSLKSSATMTITPAPVQLAKDATKEIIKEPPRDEEVKENTGAKPRGVVKKKITSTKPADEKPTATEKQEEVKVSKHF